MSRGAVDHKSVTFPMYMVRSLCTVILSALFAAGCAPTVDRAWLKANCQPVPAFVADTCEQFSNCQRVDQTQCKCTLTNGVYTGELRGGKNHGWGTYLFTNSARYDGYWWDGAKFCGVEKTGTQWFVYQNSRITSQGDSSDAAAAVFGALAIGFAAYATSQSSGGGGGYSAYDYEWDWDGFYGKDGQWVWACRGVQTGQFALQEKCNYKRVDDDRWPTTGAP